MIPTAKLDRLIDRHAAIESELASGATGSHFVKLAREHAELSPVIETARACRTVLAELEDATALICDPLSDGAMRAMAEEERARLKEKLAELDHRLKLQLMPKDAMDASSAIVEIRAGTGG
ncbi:MAG: PCRF domain-containing protein, partial [Rhizomicrobium sp.]